MNFYTIEKIENQLREIRESIHREVRVLGGFRIFEDECPGAQCAEFDDQGWQPYTLGDYWGGYDTVAWFRAWVDIPEDWKDQKVVVRLLVGPRDGGGSTAETLLYVNGEPLQAIDVWHEEAWLPPELLRAGKILLALKAWSGTVNPPDRRRFKVAELIRIDEAAERFYHRALGVVSAAKLLDENDLRRIRTLQALNASFHCIDFVKPRSEAYYRSLVEAESCLASGLEKLQANELKPKVTCIGHSHIDMAWLWRLCHTREKASRTFSTVLHLMRQYPEYRFMHSSPQLYKFLKEDYPEIYARVKERIRSGEWEITGGMWVEADTNLTGGESLIRQFLYGRRFIKEEFGVDTNILWLPDVFGYSAALPQIIKKSGIKYFLTSKISWSQFNRFPYDTFNWRGIDGTEVLTHFITTPDNNRFYTYNGTLSAKEVKGIWDNYRQKEVNDELLLLFGWGDGGGGPTKEMLESARALQNLPGLPRVEIGKAEPFFSRLAERVAGKDLPDWDGELYLEYHRGTYTSQAEVKRSNRKSEFLYHNAEWLCSMADVLAGTGSYPAEDLKRGWERILLNQFHDILPGSSIRQVYEDTRKDYEEITRTGARAARQAQDAILKRIPAERESILVFNPLSWDRRDLVTLPLTEDIDGKTLMDEKGVPTAYQLVEEGGREMILLEAGEVPSLGYRAFPLTDQAANGGLASIAGEPVSGVGFRSGEYYRTGKDRLVEPDPHRKGLLLNGTKDPGGDELIVRPDRMENRCYRLDLNEKGQIASLYDKRYGREVLAPGRCGNVLQAFEDKPMNFDAWDIDIYYQEKVREIGELVETVVEESGPLRGTLRLTWKFADSTITQRLSLYRSSPRIDFRTEVDWHEHQVLLKAAFPVQVRSPRATYDIQFGSLERPTHWNTSWDAARFEVVGHKWADLSEGNYGVALLNDCKYGYDVKKDVLRLTLIKSGIEPDKSADQGYHRFTYSLLPHQGGWREGDVVREAYGLNNPLLARVIPTAQEGTLPRRFAFAEVDTPTAIVETIKKAEDGDAWVLRVYEYGQCRLKNVHLRLGQAICKAVTCNLVEEQEEPVAWEGNTLTFDLAPFEVKTFKVWL